jgi:O-methyltransferase
MIDLAKRAVLQALNGLGYRVLKKQEHERLLAAAARSQSSDAPLSSPLAPPSMPAPDPQITKLGAAPAKLVERLNGSSSLSLPRVAALDSIADYLTRAGLEGEVVDCGYGNTASLAVLAAAFVQLGDTNRRFALFDTSADPLHRPELEFELWGTGRDPLSTQASWRRLPTREPPPRELAVIGYPVEKFSIRRYPREPIAQTDPVAFLGLTTACYQSNQATIATFLPRVITGGVIAVEPDPLERSGRDAVDDLLRNQGIEMLFLHVAPDYRVGIKP